MTVSLDDVIALEALETKLRTLLPALYADTYKDVLPLSMGSAALKYDPDGRVAWDEIWATFCDLAMAGGPPHRGTLLQPALESEIDADPGKYGRVVSEIGRGIAMVTGLSTEPSDTAGWVGVRCHCPGMAAWLVRAIVMENVLARHDRQMLYVPAGPEYRLAKEIKNVITSTAKTCHYWTSHMSEEQRQSIEGMLSKGGAGSELLEPASLSEIQAEPEAYRQLIDRVTSEIGQGLGLPYFAHRYPGWIGIECASVRRAVWVMRAMIVDNILVRREDEVIFLPLNPKSMSGDQCARLIEAFTRAYRLLQLRNVS